MDTAERERAFSPEVAVRYHNFGGLRRMVQQMKRERHKSDSKHITLYHLIAVIYHIRQKTFTTKLVRAG